MNTQYFTLTKTSTQPKNKLQKEVWEYFENQSNKLLVEVDAAIKTLQIQVDYFNSQNPRCSPLKISVNKYNEEAISLHVRLKDGDQGPGLNFVFHKVKEN